MLCVYVVGNSEQMLGRLFTPTSAVRARFVSASVAKYRAHGAPAQVIKYAKQCWRLTRGISQLRVPCTRSQNFCCSVNIFNLPCLNVNGVECRMENEEVGNPKGSEVLIKMLAAPVNPSDINMVRPSACELRWLRSPPDV
jgi:hypothetical protein